MPARGHAALVVVIALAQGLGCGERGAASSASGSASSGAGASAAASSATPGPLATTGPDGRLIYRDGRALIGPTTVTEIREAALVHVTREKVSLEGAAVDDVPALSEKLRRADGLFDALRRRREDARLARPDAKPSDVVILDVDEDVPATAVKSVFQTCAYAGYPNTFFLAARPDAGMPEAPLPGSSAPPR